MNLDILTFYVTYKKVLKEIESEGYVTEEDVDKLLNEFSDNLELLDKEDVTGIVLELIKDVEGITPEEVELIVKETLKEVGVSKEEFTNFKKENEAWKNNTMVELEGVLSKYYTSDEVDELIGEIQAGDIDLEMVEKLIEKMVNEEVNTINSAIAAVNDNVNEHKNNTDNPHNVTKEQIGLGKVDNVKQATKKEHEAHVGKVATKTEPGHVIIGDGIDVTSDGTISVKETDISHLEEHLKSTDNPHKVTKEQVGLGNVLNVKQVTEDELNNEKYEILSVMNSSIAVVNDDVNEHKNNNNNPHGVTKGQIGLGKVDNIKQATKVEFDEHKEVIGNSDTPGHVNLSSDVTSTSSILDGVAATPLAVKTVNDKVDEVKEIAEQAFQSGNSKKKEMITVVNEKGGNLSTNATWTAIADEIRALETGGGILKVVDVDYGYDDMVDGKDNWVDGRVVSILGGVLEFSIRNLGNRYADFYVYERRGTDPWNKYTTLSMNGELYYDSTTNKTRLRISYGNGEKSTGGSGFSVLTLLNPSSTSF